DEIAIVDKAVGGVELDPARLRAFRQTLGWCQPDPAVLRGLPQPAHQRLSERLLQPPSDSAVD
ncbi:MAG TPA: hypothetical protein PK156_43200, partial [Polyangium sp.]|nr:hypothetical protein [Polyangium sp.]